MMKMVIEQLKWEPNKLWDLMMDDNIYYVRVNYRTEKNSDVTLPHPFGCSFSRLNNTKLRELIPLLESGEIALVSVRME